MTAVRFTGGGSLDGAVRELPAGVTGIVTIERDGTRSWYEIDDDGGRARFAGLGPEGEAMGNASRALREAEARDRAAVAEALRARGCGSCGGVFGSAAAFTVHRERDWPGGCLPPGALGQLAEVDGVWVIPGSDAARQ